MKMIAILGASGHGKVVADIAEKCGYDAVTFFDDNRSDNLEHWKVSGNFQDLIRRVGEFDSIAVAIGNNRVRQEKILHLKAAGAHLPRLIDPSATISRYCQIGDGTIICAGVVLSSFVKIGVGCIINTSASIDHDCVIEDYVHISPGVHLAGGVNVGKLTWVGIGASVIQLIDIGENAIIGANSTVIKSIPSNVTAVGSPTRIVK